MDVRELILEMNVEASHIADRILEQGLHWAVAYQQRETLREHLANSEHTLELVVGEIRGEQELLRELDKGQSPSQRKSRLTAGDKDSRDKQFDVWLSKLQQLEPDSTFSKATKEVKRLQSELNGYEQSCLIAERKIAALRTVADLQAARLTTMSKLV